MRTLLCPEAVATHHVLHVAWQPLGSRSPALAANHLVAQPALSDNNSQPSTRTPATRTPLSRACTVQAISTGQYFYMAFRFVMQGPCQPNGRGCQQQNVPALADGFPPVTCMHPSRRAQHHTHMIFCTLVPMAAPSWPATQAHVSKRAAAESLSCRSRI
jgi:hypothetical protein